MKPYAELTYPARVHRLRTLAGAALAKFGMADARFSLVLLAGNALFRVVDPHPGGKFLPDDLFEDGQYLLRIHQQGYQSEEGIQLELLWLAAMRREAGLPVPEPVPALDGQLAIRVAVPGIPGERTCSLLKWVKGRHARNPRLPAHFKKMGRLMAQLHLFSEKWELPAGLSKRRFDWDGLFMKDAGSGMTNQEAWAHLPQPYVEPFRIVSQKVRQAMDAMGEGRNAFGLIHADLALDANALIWHGNLRAIDFDDSGFGYWVYDLGVSLEHCWGHPEFPACRDALVNEYLKLRNMPGDQLRYLELFLAGCEVYWNLWANGGIHLYPQFREEYIGRIEKTADLVMQYAARL